jgi:hypothetical protein
MSEGLFPLCANPLVLTALVPLLANELLATIRAVLILLTTLFGMFLFGTLLQGTDFGVHDFSTSNAVAHGGIGSPMVLVVTKGLWVHSL